jgi:hypothetical protein
MEYLFRVYCSKVDSNLFIFTGNGANVNDSIIITDHSVQEKWYFQRVSTRFGLKNKSDYVQTILLFFVIYEGKKKTPETVTKRFLKRVGATIVLMTRHGFLVAERCSVNPCGFGAYPLFSTGAQGAGHHRERDRASPIPILPYPCEVYITRRLIVCKLFTVAGGFLHWALMKRISRTDCKPFRKRL